MDSTKINGIVSAVKRYLQLKIISVVLGGVGDLADQLSDMSTVLSTLLALFISVDIVASIDIIVWRVLSQSGDLFLSYLSSGLSTLHFSKLTVVHLITLEHDGEVQLAFAVANGFRNIQNLVQKMKRKRCQYDFVEVMACPSGCLNGGAQCRPEEGMNLRKNAKIT